MICQCRFLWGPLFCQRTVIGAPLLNGDMFLLIPLWFMLLYVLQKLFFQNSQLSIKNKDELKWEKAFPACTHLPPPRCSCLPCCTVTRLMGTIDEPMATAGDNPSRDLPSQICLGSSAISRQIPEAISNAVHVSNALSPFCSEESRLIAVMGTWEGGRQGHTNPLLSFISSLEYFFSHHPSVFPTVQWKKMRKSVSKRQAVHSFSSQNISFPLIWEYLNTLIVLLKHMQRRLKRVKNQESIYTWHGNGIDRSEEHVDHLYKFCNETVF